MTDQVGHQLVKAGEQSAVRGGGPGGMVGDGGVAVGQDGRQDPGHSQTQAVGAAREVLQLGHTHCVGFLWKQGLQVQNHPQCTEHLKTNKCCCCFFSLCSKF